MFGALVSETEYQLKEKTTTFVVVVVVFSPWRFVGVVFEVNIKGGKGK